MAVRRSLAGLALVAAVVSTAACTPTGWSTTVTTGGTATSTSSPKPAPSPSPTQDAPASSPASSPAPSNEIAQYEQRILTLVNAERSKAGLRPLSIAPCAEPYADNWAAEMARTGSFEHQSLSPIMSACRATRAGENIAYGNVTADRMMEMWMNSPGHRANILSSAFTHVGLGAVKTAGGRWYGVQDFVTLR